MQIKFEFGDKTYEIIAKVIAYITNLLYLIALSVVDDKESVKKLHKDYLSFWESMEEK